MIQFDLGYEIFIVPVLWGLLILSVLVATATSFRRLRIETEEGEIEMTKWTTNKKRLRCTLFLFLSGALLLGSLVVTPPGHRGVIYTASGVSPTERGEGYSLMVPLIHNASMVNVREQKYENLEVYAQTKDLLEVTVQVAVNYVVLPEQAAELFRDVGQAYELAIIEPAVLDITKREVGQVDALNFPQKRQELVTDIATSLDERLAGRGIDITYVAIQDNIFDKAFVTAVLNKEIADEKATEALRLVEVARHEAQQVRLRASGDADATALAGQGASDAIASVASALGFTSVEYLDWLRLTRWDGILPQTLLGSDQDVIIGLP